jgi:hypothetical protein
VTKKIEKIQKVNSESNKPETSNNLDQNIQNQTMQPQRTEEAS